MPATIWIEEADKAVWHRMTRREGRTTYRAVCGWELSVIAGRIWPVKAGELSPPDGERCHDCVRGKVTGT